MDHQSVYDRIHFLTASQALLRQFERKTPTADLRHRMTGHSRALGQQWVPSIGHWGGCSSPSTIQQLTGQTKAAVAMFACHHGLRTRAIGGEKLRKGQWYIAHEAYRKFLDNGKDLTGLDAQLGILPIELRLYADGGEVLVAEHIEYMQAQGDSVDLGTIFEEHWGKFQEIIAKEVRLT